MRSRSIGSIVDLLLVAALLLSALGAAVTLPVSVSGQWSFVSVDGGRPGQGYTYTEIVSSRK